MENKAAATIEQNLRLLRQLGPDPYWQDSLRSALLKQATTVKRDRWSITFRWGTTIVLSLLIAFLAGGTAVFSQGSVPGDLLYPAKRGLEDFRLVFASSEDKFVIQQQLADRRIAELKIVALEHRYEATTPAVQEVEVSIAKVSQKVSIMAARYQVLKQSGEDATSIKESLEQTVPAIEQKQTELEQIEDSLPEPSRVKVVEIRYSLEALATQVRNSLEIIEEPKPSTEPEPTSNPIPNQPSTNQDSQNTP